MLDLGENRVEHEQQMLRYSQGPLRKRSLAFVFPFFHSCCNLETSLRVHQEHDTRTILKNVTTWPEEVLAPLGPLFEGDKFDHKKRPGPLFKRISGLWQFRSDMVSTDGAEALIRNSPAHRDHDQQRWRREESYPHARQQAMITFT